MVHNSMNDCTLLATVDVYIDLSNVEYMYIDLSNIEYMYIDLSNIEYMHIT